MTYFKSLSAAGFAATAISFGPARMGFGLFVPEFKSVFSMSQSMVGLVSSFGFAGFFVGLLIAQFFVNRWGPEFPVLSGLIAATVGMGIVALAPNVPVLTTGVFVAASSAGFAWTPFNDAVHRKVREVDRPTALSKISTGTSVGIAAAGGDCAGDGFDRVQLTRLLGNLRRSKRAGAYRKLGSVAPCREGPEGWRGPHLA